MNLKSAHRLLQRQIKKSRLSETQVEELGTLFNLVDTAYRDFDEDHAHLENILELSSKELFNTNQQLKEAYESKSMEVLETKQQLERVINNVKNVIFETDLTGNFVYLNSAWKKLTGYSVKSSLGRHFLHFLNGVPKKDLKLLRRFGSSGEKKFQRIFQFTTRDGKIKWIDCDFEIISSETGIALGTIGSIVDVTKVKHTELELIKAREKEAEANRTKSEFLSTMSHEIRTPLNSIIGLSNILLLENHLESQSENLSALKYSSEHLLSLICDILDFSKITAGKVELEEKEFSLDYLLNGIKNNYQHQAYEKGIRFVIKKDSEIPNVFTGDSTRVVQILSNLVNNAIKFTEKGKVELNLEKLDEADDSILLLVEVKDTGVGIAEKNIEKIFRAFEQENSSVNRKFGGTGLGLAICNNLVEIMGSKLYVDSIKDIGSCFYFHLRLKKSPKFTVKNGLLNADIQSSFSGLKGKKVLVAEDYQMNVLVLKRFFDKWELEFEVANNGKEALEKFNTKEYDLVLMDLQMPVMDGYQATQKIRMSGSRGENTPIIALTASAQLDVKTKALEAGVNAFLSKPFNPINLFNTIRQYII